MESKLIFIFPEIDDKLRQERGNRNINEMMRGDARVHVCIVMRQQEYEERLKWSRMGTKASKM